MPSPAANLLAAFNGKSVPIPGVNANGGNGVARQYNPFATNPQIQSSTPPNAGTDLQNQTQSSQAAYQAQQNLNRSQLAATLASSSVGGGTTYPNPTPNQSSSLDRFTNQIGDISKVGSDATDLARQTALANFQTKLAGLGNQYQTNLGGAQYSNLGANYAGQLPAGTDPNSYGARAVAIARQSLNVPYIYGGNSLTQGVDCSGLVQQVYGRLGIQLPRTSTEQAKYGKIVPSLSQALPGDLILMYSPYEPAGLQQFGHVGIYIGNGMMIDAPHTGAKVRIEQISNMTRIVRPW